MGNFLIKIQMRIMRRKKKRKEKVLHHIDSLHVHYNFFLELSSTPKDVGCNYAKKE